MGGWGSQGVPYSLSFFMDKCHELRRCVLRGVRCRGDEGEVASVCITAACALWRCPGTGVAAPASQSGHAYAARADTRRHAAAQRLRRSLVQKTHAGSVQHPPAWGPPQSGATQPLCSRLRPSFRVEPYPVMTKNKCTLYWPRPLGVAAGWVMSSSRRTLEQQQV